MTTRRKDFNKYKLNYVPTEEDKVDQPHRITTASVGMFMPLTFSLESKIPYVYDQGDIGACVANCIALNIAYLNNDFTPSRLYVYYNGRKIAGKNVNEDTGLTILEGCRSVQHQMACQEAVWKYTDENMYKEPSSEAYKKKFTLQDYYYVAVDKNIQTIRQCLYEGNLILCGCMLFSSFYDSARSGNVPMPDLKNEKVFGGHCFIIVGYDDTRSVCRCVNSWGYEWGQNGFFTIPYEYILHRGITFELYIMRFTNTYIQTHNIQDKTYCCNQECCNMS